MPTFWEIERFLYHDKIKIDTKGCFIKINDKKLNFNDINSILIEDKNPIKGWIAGSKKRIFFQMIFILKNGEAIECRFNSQWRLYRALKKLPHEKKDCTGIAESFQYFIYSFVCEFLIPFILFVYVIMFIFCYILNLSIDKFGNIYDFSLPYMILLITVTAVWGLILDMDKE